jgi:hypothetical protein
MNKDEESYEGLSFAEAEAAFAKQDLFENKTWRYSPSAFALTTKQVTSIRKIGQACYDFYRAQEMLYMRSATWKEPPA